MEVAFSFHQFPNRTQLFIDPHISIISSFQAQLRVISAIWHQRMNFVTTHCSDPGNRHGKYFTPGRRESQRAAECVYQQWARHSLTPLYSRLTYPCLAVDKMCIWMIVCFTLSSFNKLFVQKCTFLHQRKRLGHLLCYFLTGFLRCTTSAACGPPLASLLSHES